MRIRNVISSFGEGPSKPRPNKPTSLTTRGIVSLCAIALSTWGCNMISGANDIAVKDYASPGANANPGTGGNGATSGTNGDSTSDGPSTTSAQGGAASSSASGGDTTSGGTTNGGASDPMAAVDGATMTDVILYQGVSRPVMKNGQNVNSDTPIIEGRDALMRVFYQTDAEYNGQAVTARLTIEGRQAIEVQATLGSSSSESDLNSTINFDVPGDAMTAGMAYRVELLQDKSLVTGANSAALYPDSANFATLAVETVGKLVITLVPIQYDADGSGRLPDTSPAQLQRYEELFYAMYPVPEVQIHVRPQPFSWDGTVHADGAGWDLLLNAIAALRSQDGAAGDEYYYGIFAPASSAGAYCGGSCVTGLGFIGKPTLSATRAAIGLGFSGELATETAVHEIGHNHGRPHAPCGSASNPDQDYPYQDASIGVFGYNLVSKELYHPENFVDMMSYCSPSWISDYNYQKLYEQAKFVSQASLHFPTQMMNLTWERVSVRPNGSLEYLDAVTMVEPPLGSETSVAVETTNGTEHLTGQFFSYDHLPGGVLYVPPSSAPRAANRALEFTHFGRVNKLRLP